MSDPRVEQAQQFTVSGPNAAFVAREMFDALDCDWLGPSGRPQARLLLSELVGAVVAQGAEPGEIGVSIDRLGAHGVRAEVAIPVRAGRRPIRAFRLIAGHRAQVLDALADRWGVVHQPGSPYVWFELGA